jgi:hypothetical protein
MRRDTRAFLWDVQHATDAIVRFTAGLDARAYADNEVITAAVERKFEIIGEALNRLSKREPDLAVRGKLVPQGYCNVGPLFGKLPVPFGGSWVANNAFTFLFYRRLGAPVCIS